MSTTTVEIDPQSEARKTRLEKITEHLGRMPTKPPLGLFIHQRTAGEVLNTIKMFESKQIKEDERFKWEEIVINDGGLSGLRARASLIFGTHNVANDPGLTSTCRQPNCVCVSERERLWLIAAQAATT